MTRKVLLIVFLFFSGVVTAQTTTVYFDFNSFMLNDETRNVLNRLITSGKITSVGFFGHTDQMGSIEFNEWLSLQRAVAVKDYLLSKGLKQKEVLVVRGFGAERLISDQPDSVSRQLNRRVTITNNYKPSPIDIAVSTRQSALHYSLSPDIIKTPVRTGTMANIKAKTTNATFKTSNQDSSAVVINDNGESIKNTAPKNGTKTDANIKVTTQQVNKTQPRASALQDIPNAKRNDGRIKDSATKSTQLTGTVDSRATPENNEKTTIAVVEKPAAVLQKEDAGGKESFADRLSKAVNEPSSSRNKNSTAVSTIENNNAPIVKQQKHDKLIEDINDKTTKVGEHIVLRHIHFYGGRHAFLPQAYPALDDLLETMQKVPALRIEIQGHICCQEGEGDQIDFDSGEPVLSVTRAKAVYDFLLENGIDKTRMSYVGLAHKFPIIQVETNEEEATINRRVEIKIIKK